jgi:hypothetical protein
MDSSIVAQWDWLHNVLDENKADLGIEILYKGDQQKISAAPAVCTEPGPKRRELIGAQRQMSVNNDLYILVYVGTVDDPAVNTEDAVKLCEDIEDLLHAHAQMGGLVIHSYVQAVEPGYATRGTRLMRAARMTLTTLAQELLPASAP